MNRDERFGGTGMKDFVGKRRKKTAGSVKKGSAGEGKRRRRNVCGRANRAASVKIWGGDGIIIADIAMLYRKNITFASRKKPEEIKRRKAMTRNIQQDKAVFLSFCIEQYAKAKGLPTDDVVNLFEQYGIAEHFCKFYEVLHTQGGEWLVEEIDEMISKRKR